MRINKDIEYGLMSLIAMENREGVASARELSDSLRIPLRLLSKILQRLARGGLIRSVQGPKGGYRLERPLNRISFKEVIQAIQGHFSIVPCLARAHCGQEELCNIHDGMKYLQGSLAEHLHSLTLKQFEQKHVRNRKSSHSKRHFQNKTKGEAIGRQIGYDGTSEKSSRPGIRH